MTNAADQWAGWSRVAAEWLEHLLQVKPPLLYAVRELRPNAVILFLPEAAADRLRRRLRLTGIPELGIHSRSGFVALAVHGWDVDGLTQIVVNCWRASEDFRRAISNGV